mmetsp:Transcript_4377/g.10830  ORF Transcript_4377/g.10830 Transcript_4377/m.10830 type:complete len:548 (+) Transcript_4377:133-1776(+)
MLSRWNRLLVQKDGQISLLRLFAPLLLFRVLNALLIRTFFNPDEYWQSLEVAHHAVFGYGSLTWEWEEELRGFLHPFLFAVPLQILRWFGCATPFLKILLPKLVQAAVAALTDLYVFALARLLHSQPQALYALLCHLCLWFNSYCLVRTFSNSLESCLVVMALFFLWRARLGMGGSRTGNVSLNDQRCGWALAALSIAVRPTAALVWVAVGLHFVLTTQRPFRSLFCDVLPVGLAVTLVVSLLLDRLYYGRFTVVLWNFIRFNVVGSGGSFYGTHRWHWYLSNALPQILGPLLPLTIVGVYRSDHELSRLLILTVLWPTVVYSVFAHKELRFLLPCVPVLMIACGSALHYVCVQWPRLRGHSEGQGSAVVRIRHHSVKQGRQKDRGPTSSRSTFHRAVLSLVVLQLVLNAPLALYFGVYHQRGVIDAIDWVRVHTDPALHSVFFFMPCHSTPLYSHVGRPIPMKFLECRPPLPGRIHYDEADHFFDDPVAFIEHAPFTATHLVMFEPTAQTLAALLSARGYSEIVRFWHTWTPTDHRHGDVVIFVKE